jgi:hypothetical protein
MDRYVGDLSPSLIRASALIEEAEREIEAIKRDLAEHSAFVGRLARALSQDARSRACGYRLTPRARRRFS